MIKVSVVMPVYNVEEYLEEALLSVMKQTLREIEIICVNDGSTDGSLNILKKYADMDKRIRIISKENSGYGHTMNVGMDAAVGEYIGVVETDDYIEPDMYEKLYEKANRDNLDFVKADSTVFVADSSGERQFKVVNALPEKCSDLYETVTSYALDERVFNSYVYTWAGIYRRQFLNANNIRHNETPGASYQDNGFWFQTIMYAERVSFVRECFYNLRRDNPNSSVKRKDKVFCMFDEYDFIREKIQNSGLDNQKRLLQIAFYYRFISYQFHYKRIADELKPIMMERIQKDVMDEFENGEVSADMFSKVQWQQIFAIVNEGKMISPEMVQMSDRMKQKIDEAEEIYIYGAGAWGKNVFNRLQACFGKDKIKGFLVTDKEEGQEELFDLQVKQIDEVEPREGLLVVAAVADKYLGEVITLLLNKGHMNFILKNDMY